MLKASKIVTPISIKYSDFLSGKDLSDILFESYGPFGTGYISVSEIPKYQTQRQAILKQARELYNLPTDLKIKLQCPESNYLIGWSQGKEVYKGQVNESQSVFYTNYFEKEESYLPLPNLWPGAELPNFKSAHKAFNLTVYNTTLLVLDHLDKLLKKHSLTVSLKQIISESRHPITLLLHYLPQKGPKEWSRWHCDHDIIVGLCCPLYTNEDSGEQVDPEALNWETNLCIRNKDDEIMKVRAKPDELLIHIGETSQIITGGILRATPHAVITDGTQEKLSRSTYALFFDPKPEFRITCPKTKYSDFSFIDYDNMAKLSTKWKDGITFEEFGYKTFT